MSSGILLNNHYRRKAAAATVSMVLITDHSSVRI